MDSSRLIIPLRGAVVQSLNVRQISFGMSVPFSTASARIVGYARTHASEADYV
jgi:hypothetical protein